jgi:2-desacetyl-2-hydroxyethyl bacteriochlorophyllide A dehydrogenase
MPHELLLTGPRQIALAPYNNPPLAAEEVRAQAVLSAISHGTELNLYRGTSAFHERRFDPALRLFVASTDRALYPTRLGYEWIGRVTKVGAAVTGYAPGDLVHLPLPHRETHSFAPASMASLGVAGPLPAALRPEQPAFLSSISIALQAVHDARIKLGDHVLLFGLGALGLLTVQVARRSGAGRVDAVDPIASRRDLALGLGADNVFDPTAIDLGLALKQSGPGADVAIEFSGSYAALHEAIRCVRQGGLVVAAGFYQGDAQALRLGEEWHHNRVTMVASQRGWGNPHRDHPLWDRPRLHAAAIDLLAGGRLHVEPLITQRIPFTRAADAYDLLDRDAPDALKVVLTYEQS